MGLRIRRSTLAAQVESALRDDIIAGTLSPGQRLKATELAERYGVSSTPLREALQRLAAERLVDITEGMGATVAPVSTADVRDAYWLRSILERIAVERAIELADDTWRRQIGMALEALRAAGDGDDQVPDVAAYSVAHSAFQDALFAGCGSPWLVQVLAVLYNHCERYRRMVLSSESGGALREHERIAALAVSGDAKAATEAIQAHLAQTVAMLEAVE